ncbi:MAG TPA: nuclear transport factor 2 family protein [Robiginitalea sp.]|nr:nuclear transport factor 2 family protein [Robiginitalea sp.]
MDKRLLACMPFLWAACGNPPKPCEKVADEEARQVLVDYFRAISDNDFDALKNLSTPDYVLFEDGQIWNNDSLIQALKKMPEASVAYELKDFSFKADCNGSFVSYKNRGMVTLNDTTRLDLNWVESAYVKQVEGVPRLAFLHSSVAK